MDFMGLFSLHNKIHPMSLPFPWSTFIPYSHIRSPKGLERQRSVNNRRERIWPGRDTTVRFFSSHSFMVIMSCLFPLPPLTFGSRCSRTKWTVREREWRECRGPSLGPCFSSCSSPSHIHRVAGPKGRTRSRGDPRDRGAVGPTTGEETKEESREWAPATVSHSLPFVPSRSGA